MGDKDIPRTQREQAETALGESLEDLEVPAADGDQIVGGDESPKEEHSGPQVR